MATRKKTEEATTTVLNGEQLAHFQRLLLEKKTEALETIRSSSENRKSELSVNDNESSENRLANHASDPSAKEKLISKEIKLIAKIKAALASIENGTYGICVDCGLPISVQRLEARPISDLCVICKERKEMKERRLTGGNGTKPAKTSLYEYH